MQQFFFRDMASIVFDREDADDQVLAQALYVNEVDLGDEDTDQVNFFLKDFFVFVLIYLTIFFCFCSLQHLAKNT